jgi:hypothetical protein
MVYVAPAGKKMLELIINVPASVRESDERFDFEPLSWWIQQEDGSSNVRQRVYMQGSRLVGESGTYEEDLVEVVKDHGRFVSLKPLLTEL